MSIMWWEHGYLILDIFKMYVFDIIFYKCLKYFIKKKYFS